MDPNAKPTSKLKELAKVALIPVLALVLLWIVVNRFSDSDPTPTNVVIDPASSAKIAEGTVRPLQDSSAKSWPLIPLEEVLAHNPFAEPEFVRDTAFASTEEANRSAQKVQIAGNAPEAGRLQTLLKNHEVSAIARHESGVTAVIDSRIVREGDLLDGGVRVVKILDYGVVVELETIPENPAQPQQK